VKVKQISAAENRLFVLMEDGSLWKLSKIGTFAETNWIEMELPQKKKDER
jgi:hypothetical protein